MASKYIGVNIGETLEDVTHGSSTTTSDVEVVVDLTNGLTTSDIVIALDLIKAYLVENDYPLS